MKEKQIKKMQSWVDELNEIERNIKQINKLAKHIVTKQCDVDFAFSVKTEKEDKIGFDEDGSLTRAEARRSGVGGGMWNILSERLSEPETHITETLNISIRPTFSMTMLEVILKSAEERKETLVKKLQSV